MRNWTLWSLGGVAKAGWKAISSRLPALMVVAALLGLGYWGHEHQWRWPKFSALLGSAPKPDTPWCNEHNVPEEICIACHPELMPKEKIYGWCSEHGVHECVLDHPQVAQLKQVPLISQQERRRVALALKLRPRQQNNPSCKLHLRRIQFASEKAVERAGIEIDIVQRGLVRETISTVAEVRYDPTQVAKIAPRASGTIWKVFKNIGDPVHQGEVLALIDAAEVGQAKSMLLEALASVRLHKQTLQRLQKIESVVAGKRILETQTALTQAQAQLHKALQTLANFGLPVEYEQIAQQSLEQLARGLPLLGLPPQVAQLLQNQPITSNLLPVLAPEEGVVVWRQAVIGQVVRTSEEIFTIANTRRMWLILNVPVEELPYLHLGQKVEFEPDGTKQKHIGAINWISTQLDRQTRTVEVRVELDNSQGLLRDEMFGTAQIILREDPHAILVPSSAIHWEGCCWVVFVRDKHYHEPGAYKVFHTRTVRPGVKMGDMTEIIVGVLPGEVIVTEGGEALRAELLKGNLGAG